MKYVPYADYFPPAMMFMIATMSEMSILLSPFTSAVALKVVLPAMVLMTATTSEISTSPSRFTSPFLPLALMSTSSARLPSLRMFPLEIS